MKKTTRLSTSKTSPNIKRRVILDTLLAQIPFDGWTEAAYANALKKAKITRAEADQLLPNGLSDLVDTFVELADTAMQERIKAERGFARFRVRDKITFAVQARLTHLMPHREAMRRLLVWYAMPQHAVRGIKRLAKTVDLMWIAAGDTATDYNRYTKRILLAGVLKATMLYWLNDESEDCAETWAFLDRRIGDVMRLGKSLSLLQEFTPSEIGDFIRRKMRRA